MALPQMLPPEDEPHDKVLESKLAELIGTTTKALQRKRERGIIPRGVWNVIDGRVMYSKRRYDAWVESLWTCQQESRSSADRSASASRGQGRVLQGDVKPLRIPQPKRGSRRQPVLELR